MKLATYQDGSRDGQLVVVSRDLSTAHFATGIATRLQQVLDDWSFLSPQLEDLYTTLNHGKARHAFAFDPALCAAPLPRAGQWAQAQAYPSYEERLWPAGQTNQPAAAHAAPPITHGASDDFLGPCQDVVMPATEDGIDCESGLAVVTGDIEAGADAHGALEGVRLLLLVNAWQLRRPMAAGAPPTLPLDGLHARPAAAFGPVAVTPDELGEAWSGGRVHLGVDTVINGKRLGLCAAGDDMRCHFGEIMASIARVRRLRAGSIVGSGAVSNVDPARGFGNIAEKRALELRDHGTAKTPFLRGNDRIRIEVKGHDGLSLFGAIDQRLRGITDTAKAAEPTQGLEVTA
jgi:fumarylacetoacetate (FAA) hydrolase